MEWLLEKPIAHRGLHCEEKPENSLAAFEEAVKNGYPIEIDVQLTLDEKVIVFHDENLARLTNINKLVKDTSLNEINNLKIGKSEETIPTLNKVLQIINGKVPLLIEIKNKNNIGRLEANVAKELESYKGKFAIQSFNPYTLNWFRVNYPNYLRGQLSCEFKDEDLSWYKKLLLRYLLLNFISRPDFVAYDIDSLPFFMVSFLRRKGVPILAWTINNKERLKKSALYSDNIIFESIINEFK